MRIIETKVYKIDEHPNKELCFEWIRNNWYDLNDYSLEEIKRSIEELSKRIGGDYDYSISCTPDRNEYINFWGYDEEELNNLDADAFPLTGTSWDAEIIEALRIGIPERALRVLHERTEYIYSNEALYELCKANEHEFNEQGELI